MKCRNPLKNCAINSNANEKSIKLLADQYPNQLFRGLVESTVTLSIVVIKARPVIELKTWH